MRRKLHAATAWPHSRAQHLNNLTYKIIAAAIEVHRYLGPGLLESVYQRCMERELEGHPLGFKAQQPLKVDYKGMNIDCGFRIDLYIEDLVIAELKSRAGALSRS